MHHKIEMSGISPIPEYIATSYPEDVESWLINIEEQFGSMEEFRRVREGWYKDWEKNSPNNIPSRFVFGATVQSFDALNRNRRYYPSDNSQIKYYHGLLYDYDLAVINKKYADSHKIPFRIVTENWNDDTSYVDFYRYCKRHILDKFHIVLKGIMNGVNTRGQHRMMSLTMALDFQYKFGKYWEPALKFRACHMMLEHTHHAHRPWEYRIASSKTSDMSIHNGDDGIDMYFNERE